MFYLHETELSTAKWSDWLVESKTGIEGTENTLYSELSFKSLKVGIGKWRHQKNAGVKKLKEVAFQNFLWWKS